MMKASLSLPAGLDSLRRNIRTNAVNLRFQRPERSFLESVFARGDRRLGRLLLEAHRLGCRFDAWDEICNFQKWQRAFEEAEISGERYANRSRDKEEVLPWSHIGAGVSDRADVCLCHGGFSVPFRDPPVADAPAAARGLGLAFAFPDGTQWRTAMLNLPVFLDFLTFVSLEIF